MNSPRRKPRTFRFKRYQVPKYIKDALATLKPPDDITVSQWAERNRILSRKESNLQGYWRNSVTPYLTGIMDEFNNWETEQIIFVKPTQCGGTEGELNMLGYVIDQDPAPVLIVYPNDELAESTSANRISSMMETPCLKRHYLKNSSSKKELQFDTDMYVALTGSNSPADLASKPIRYLFLDEVDKYSAASRQEADPINLAIERTKSYITNRKIYMCSTPTLRTGHIWKAKEAADVEKHFFVPCPHCGKYIELVCADPLARQGRRHERPRPGRVCELRLPGMRLHHNRPAQAGNAAARRVAGRAPKHPLCPERSVLDEYAVQPLYTV